MSRHLPFKKSMIRQFEIGILFLIKIAIENIWNKKQFYLLNPGIGFLVHRMYQRVALLMFLHIRIHPVTLLASNIAKGTTDPEVEYFHQMEQW